MKRAWLAGIAPYLWLLAFFAFPFLLVAKLSLSHTVLAIPPYAPRLKPSLGLPGLAEFARGLSLETYGRLVSDRLYLNAYLSSLK
ncbi:MAG: putrescine ABC transporter permease PotH, partial [Phenylobacterium sp.]